MPEDRSCENCGRPVNPLRHAAQRFCCRACSDEWFAAERRQAVEWFRASGIPMQTKVTREKSEDEQGKEHAA